MPMPESTKPNPSMPNPPNPPSKRPPCKARSPSPRPQKRQRRIWASVVEQLALANGIEEDEHRIAQRQKQIDYGKNTLAYDKFSAVLPRDKRTRGDPMTPLARQKCSKRSFAGQVTSWKKRVYDFVAALEEVREEREREEKKGAKEDGAEEVKSCANSVERSDTVETAEDDDYFSDMDDIQLDDFGNVIPNEPASPAEGQSDKVGEKEAEESPSSIFEVY